jgi:hypothetical protein
MTYPIKLSPLAYLEAVTIALMAVMLPVMAIVGQVAG